MKNIIFALLLSTTGILAQAQTKPDSAKSARDYIIENENKRTSPPNKIKREIKTISSTEENGKAATKQKSKKCCFFCKKKPQS